jgi:predicted RNase H-like HicB family nuclease
MMKTINVVIEPGRDGFAVTFKNKGLENISSFGETIDEAKENAKDAIRETITYYKETGQELIEPFISFDKGSVKYRYSFMLKYYFKEFAYLNVTRLATSLGINPSLLRQYDKGLAKASEEKFIEIRDGLRKVGKELLSAV